MFVKIWSSHGYAIGPPPSEGTKDFGKWVRVSRVFEVDDVQSQFCSFDNWDEYCKFNDDSLICYDEVIANIMGKDVALKACDLQMERKGKKFRCLVVGYVTIFLMNEHGDTIDSFAVMGV